MKKEELNFILQEGEGFHIEFKENVSGIDKDMSAFANAEGGRIFIGVTDAGKIKAVEFTNRLKAEINDIAKNCDPAIAININKFNNVIIVEVPPSDDKPWTEVRGQKSEDRMGDKIKEKVLFLLMAGFMKMAWNSCNFILQSL